MLGIFGSLSISVLSCCVLLLVMGMFGYLKYGSQVQASITFNLPREDPLAQSCQVMFVLAVFLSYALQYYVVMEIAGPNLIEPFVSRPFYLFAEYLFRSVLNVLISKSIPRLKCFYLIFFSRSCSSCSLAGPLGHPRLLLDGGPHHHHHPHNHRHCSQLGDGLQDNVQPQIPEERYNLPPGYGGDGHGDLCEYSGYWQERSS